MKVASVLPISFRVFLGMLRKGKRREAAGGSSGLRPRQPKRSRSRLHLAEDRSVRVRKIHLWRDRFLIQSFRRSIHRRLLAS